MRGEPLTPENILAFGKHAGTKLCNVPNSYFTWLIQQDWFQKSELSYHRSLKEYIENNLKQK